MACKFKFAIIGVLTIIAFLAKMNISHAANSTQPGTEAYVVHETQLAKNLGLSKNQLELQTHLLSQYLGGVNRNGLLQACKKNSEDKKTLCKLIIALETIKDPPNKIRIQRDEFYGRTPGSVDPSNFAEAQRAKPGDLLDVMKNYQASEVLSWAPRLLMWKSCPQNLLVASLRMYEVTLPNPKARAALEVGYRHVMKCLNSNNSYYEITHQRQALLRFMWGDKIGAERALKLALQADEPKARDLTLFWLGYIEKSKKVKKVYWDELISQYPLSFHAITAAKLSGKDLHDNVLARRFLMPQRKAVDVTSQLGILWLESLYMYGEEKHAVNLSYKLFKKFKHRYSPANFAYIAALSDKYSLPSEAMDLSATFVQNIPNLLSNQMLRYLYPRAFEKTFDRIAQKIDPLLSLSIAKQESGFNPYARSPANARGLMQILPTTAGEYAKRSDQHLYDIDTNIEVGGKILADLIERLGSLELAIAAYNAGYNRVDGWRKRYSTDNSMLFIDLIPYNETRNYVSNVLRNHYWYTHLYPLKKPTDT